MYTTRIISFFILLFAKEISCECENLQNFCDCDVFTPTWVKFPKTCNFYCKDTAYNFLKTCKEVNLGRQGGSCLTADRKGGLCIPLSNCPYLQKRDKTSKFFQESLCKDNQGNEKICCDFFSTSYAWNDTVSLQNTKAESHRELVIRKLLPTAAYCGMQHTDDRFYNSSDTALDEFPWLVHMDWPGIQDNYVNRCNGFLISKRYVLTDYLCGYYTSQVKLGQHVTDKSTACIEDPYLPECTDPVVTVAVEDKFIYNGFGGSGYFNLYLVRLAKNVEFSDFIRPICLPVDRSIRDQELKTLVFSGWGSKGPEEVIKKRLFLSSQEKRACFDEDEFLEGLIESAKVDLACLKADANNTQPTCNGDHGGPVMFSYKHRWYAKAIFITTVADYGSTYCSDNKYLVKGLEISEKIVNWILDHMRE